MRARKLSEPFGGPSQPQRWMLFVDGENLTIRSQAFAKAQRLVLEEGDFFRKDVYLWPEGLAATRSLAETTLPLQAYAVRAYYYTTLVGDRDVRRRVEDALKEIGFTPRVFTRVKGHAKAKGVDISLATDMLGHAFRDHFDAAFLIAGDGDYVPLVEEVKRLGKLVYVAFLEEHGTHPDLRLAADEFFDVEGWLAAHLQSEQP